MSSWAYLLTAGVVSWVVKAIYNLYFHPLSRYPGSKVAAVSSSWWEWYWNYYHNGRLLFEVERLHQQHGPVIRIGVNDLHVSDMAVYQDITKVNTNFTKDPHFYQFISFPGTSIGETNPAKHRVRRKVLTPALSGTRIQELAPLIEAKTIQLLGRFDESNASGSPVCVTAAAKAFTMDIISKIVLGQELGCLTRPDFRSELSDNLNAAFETGWIGPSFPNVSAVAMWSCANMTEKYLKRFGPGCQTNGQAGPATQEELRPLTVSTGRGERSAVIDMLMDPKAVKGHSLPTLEELSDELAMLLTAGSDTSSNAIISGIYYVCHHTNIYQTLLDELKEAFPSLGTDITYENARKLTYLQAVVKETLRLGHPLPGRLPRKVPAEGYTLYGHHLPPGVNIHTSAYILNRHADIWDRPNDFDPTRWLSEDAATLDKQLTTFGRGARQCLGKEYVFRPACCHRSFPRAMLTFGLKLGFMRVVGSLRQPLSPLPSDAYP
ncbi:cytochrome P450 [Sodiomyces alkalinus F11]|uniref:Cytochrome P450 n=1 Tax=Sodiomyces alkalinus (strain CBS 110278 / VKM F-3762 / F11) TaxID=1314773 RepID=A0A3N2Q208_SODAK|nr:cytochrome P450 [Sodiomyces alkalinus F11]ROT40789.1 cytochrome P450 [Sodiomyces alkalinus F11]